VFTKEKKNERRKEKKRMPEMIVHEQYENENEGKNKNLFWERLVGFLAMDEDKNMFAGLMYAGQICCGTTPLLEGNLN